LDKYGKVRNGYVRYVLRNRNNPLNREILEYAKKKGFKVALAHVFLAYISRILFPPSLERRVKRMLPNSVKRRIRLASAKAGFF